MKCHCGHTLKNIPDWLAQDATWICQSCRNRHDEPGFRFELKRPKNSWNAEKIAPRTEYVPAAVRGGRELT